MQDAQTTTYVFYHLLFTTHAKNITQVRLGPTLELNFKKMRLTAQTLGFYLSGSSNQIFRYRNQKQNSTTFNTAFHETQLQKSTNYDQFSKCTQSIFPTYCNVFARMCLIEIKSVFRFVSYICVSMKRLPCNYY